MGDLGEECLGRWILRNVAENRQSTRHCLSAVPLVKAKFGTFLLPMAGATGNGGTPWGATSFSSSRGLRRCRNERPSSCSSRRSIKLAHGDGTEARLDEGVIVGGEELSQPFYGVSEDLVNGVTKAAREGTTDTVSISDGRSCARMAERT